MLPKGPMTGVTGDVFRQAALALASGFLVYINRLAVISSFSHLQKFKLDSKAIERDSTSSYVTDHGGICHFPWRESQQKRPPDLPIKRFPSSEDMENPHQDTHFTDQKTEAQRK